MATQTIDLGATNTVKFNGNDVQKIYLNSSLIWEGPYETAVTDSSHSSTAASHGYKYRAAVGKVCGKGVPATHDFGFGQLHYNLPSSKFSGVTKASVLIDWSSTTGWSSTTNPSTNKYISGCPTSDADTGASFATNTCNMCSVSPATNVLGFMPHGDHSRYNIRTGNTSLAWGDGTANSNSPNSTFSSDGSNKYYQRLGFVYSPGGYAWRNGSGGIGEMVYAFYDPNNTRVTVQYHIGSLKRAVFNAYSDSWRNVVKGATMRVVIGGRNTNCPDVIISGNSWDAT